MSTISSIQLPEEYLTVKQLANEWKVSTDTVRRHCADKPGVVVISNPKPGKRPYRTLRIPRSVADTMRKK
jgi:hypothetical protein